MRLVIAWPEAGAVEIMHILRSRGDKSTADQSQENTTVSLLVSPSTVRRYRLPPPKAGHVAILRRRRSQFCVNSTDLQAVGVFDCDGESAPRPDEPQKCPSKIEFQGHLLEVIDPAGAYGNEEPKKTAQMPAYFAILKGCDVKCVVFDHIVDIQTPIQGSEKATNHQKNHRFVQVGGQLLALLDGPTIGAMDMQLAETADRILAAIQFPPRLSRPRSKLYDVCIVGGLGHVGLPLGISLADCGKRVMLYDLNEKAIETVSEGKMPFKEVGAEAVLQKVLDKNLFISRQKEVIRQSYFVVIVIGTPVDEHLNPKFAAFKRFINEIVECIDDNQHIILRSTVFPGTTEKIRQYLHSLGKRPKISFCPERIVQGMAMEELRSLPQIVSSFEKESLVEVKELFSLLTEDVFTLSPAEAELAKIFANVWRYVQFAMSNQFYTIAAEHELDFYQICGALTANYPRLKGMTRPGFAAGPCLFKDTMQLASFSNNKFFLGHAAMLINEALPDFVIDRLQRKYPLEDMTAGILGMAFKADNDDKRESLSYKLKKMLDIEAKEVLCSDVYIREEGFVDADELIERSDVIILATPHKQYADLEISSDKIVVDIWNFFGNGGLF